MAVIIPDGMYRAKLRWRLDGDPEEIICTLGLRNNEPGDRNLNDVARAVFDAWNGAWETSEMINSYAIVGCDIEAGTGSGDNEQGFYNETVVGGTSASALPQNCAMLLKKKTASAGRRNSGRMFLPPAYLSEAGVSATGVLSSGELPTLQTWANQFFANLTDSSAIPGAPETSFTPVILHSVPPGDPPVALLSTDITSFVVDPMIATQRRRMRR